MLILVGKEGFASSWAGRGAGEGAGLLVTGTCFLGAAVFFTGACLTGAGAGACFTGVCLTGAGGAGACFAGTGVCFIVLGLCLEGMFFMILLCFEVNVGLKSCCAVILGCTNLTCLGLLRPPLYLILD